ncbi:hypothetical protein [Campylobacter coli]|uniref:hypothetical protein n=1 Tax=Campylobacter coli TaxID=195 RepID=UPI00092E388E|nr:hypothetical protein [Campylobacter coli]
MIYIKNHTKETQDIWNNFNKDAKNGLFMFDRNYMDYHSAKVPLIFIIKSQHKKICMLYLEIMQSFLEEI